MHKNVAQIAAIFTLATMVIGAQTDRPTDGKLKRSINCSDGSYGISWEFPRIMKLIQAFSGNAPLDSKDAMEVPDWQDWFSPMWLEDHKGEKIGHGYRQFRAGGGNAGAISMGYKFAEGNQGLSAEELKDEWSLESTGWYN